MSSPNRPAEHADQERRTIQFVGNVQGVGFRFTTRQVARGFAVMGYVRNLPNGRVELVVEGISEILDAFAAAVSNRMRRQIDETLVVSEAATGEFDGFEIRH